MIWTGIVTKLLGTLLAAYGFGLITPISWTDIALVWGYAIIGAFFTDWAKVTVYRHFAMEGSRHEGFLKSVQQTITPYPKHHHGEV
jgi:H+-transporting ATPase